MEKTEDENGEEREVEIALGRAIFRYREDSRRSAPARQNILADVANEYHTLTASKACVFDENSAAFECESSIAVASALKQLEIISKTFMLLGDCTDFAHEALANVRSASSSSSSSTPSTDIIVSSACKEIANHIHSVAAHSTSSVEKDALPVSWVRRVVLQALATDIPACEGVAYMLSRFVLYRRSWNSTSTGPFAEPIYHGVCAALGTLPSDRKVLDPLIFSGGVPPLLSVVTLAVRETFTPGPVLPHMVSSPADSSKLSTVGGKTEKNPAETELKNFECDSNILERQRPSSSSASLAATTSSTPHRLMGKQNFSIAKTPTSSKIGDRSFSRIRECQRQDWPTLETIHDFSAGLALLYSSLSHFRPACIVLQRIEAEINSQRRQLSQQKSSGGY